MGHGISAARQCGPSFLPDLRQPLTVADYLPGCECAIRPVGQVRIVQVGESFTSPGTEEAVTANGLEIFIVDVVGV